MSTELLNINHLSAGIDGKEIIRDISLNIGKGETHVLMGRNGAGKSTLGHVIMGNPKYSVTSGRIIFNGDDITEFSADARAKAGIFMSFQEPPQVAGLPLDKFLKTAMDETGNSRIKYIDFLKELKNNMELLKIPQSYAGRELNVGFSGGEKKKAEILQLMMLKPRLAILDETDSGLDVDAAKIVSEGIHEYQIKNNGALLIITHSTRILESLKVDFVHVCVDGRIVKSGDASLIDTINEKGYETMVSEEK